MPQIEKRRDPEAQKLIFIRKTLNKLPTSIFVGMEGWGSSPSSHMYTFQNPPGEGVPSYGGGSSFKKLVHRSQIPFLRTQFSHL